MKKIGLLILIHFVRKEVNQRRNDLIDLMIDAMENTLEHDEGQDEGQYNNDSKLTTKK